MKAILYPRLSMQFFLGVQLGFLCILFDWINIFLTYLKQTLSCKSSLNLSSLIFTWFILFQITNRLVWKFHSNIFKQTFLQILSYLLFENNFVRTLPINTTHYFRFVVNAFTSIFHHLITLSCSIPEIHIKKTRSLVEL